jgi:hypothetical protein
MMDSHMQMPWNFKNNVSEEGKVLLLDVLMPRADNNEKSY